MILTSDGLTPVVELLRVSLEKQAAPGTTNLDAQRSENLRTCQRYGLHIVESVQVVVSGAEVAESEAMEQLLAVVTSGRARGVVAAQYSRLLRPDRWTDLWVLQVLHDHSAPIYLPTGPIDLQTDGGFIQATALNMGAAMERRNIRRSMERGKEERRSRGEHVSGGVGLPLGIGYVKGQGWHHTADAGKVRDLFRWFLGGERSFAELGRRIGVSGFAVSQMLRNPTYMGIREYALRQVRVGKKVSKAPRAPGDVLRVKIDVEPLVSPEDFDTVQRLLAAKGTRPGRVSRADELIYQGFLRCAEHGTAVYGTSKNHGRWMYYCAVKHKDGGKHPCSLGHVKRELLEPLLDAAVVEHLCNVDTLTAALVAYAASRTAAWRSQQVDAGEVRARITSGVERRRRVVDAFIDGAIPAAERDQRISAIDAEIAAAEATLAELEAPALPPELTPEVVQAVVRAFAAWRVYPRGMRRRVLVALAPTFYVDRRQVHGVHLPFATLGLAAGAGEIAGSSAASCSPAKRCRR